MRCAPFAPRLRVGGLWSLALLASLATSAGAQQGEGSDSLRVTVERIAEHPLGAELPPLDSITRGGSTVAAGDTILGRLAATGTIEVFGTVTGDVVAIGGDVIVHRGALVRGDALSVGGRVQAEGGIVEGEMRSFSGVGAGLARAPVAARSPVEATKDAVALALGWLTMLVIIGIGVLMFAGTHLHAVEEALEQRFSRSFWAGVLGQLAIAPALVIVIVALALTVIGILLIPFAVVAYALLVAGLLTLGFLAAARRTGAAVMRSDARGPAEERRARLRAMLVGVLLYVGLWVLAAAFTWSPIIGGILRGLAAIVTWVVLTLGLGATILTRAGTRTHTRRITPPVPEELAWTTPTPVTGVAAARRPTPVARARETR